MLNLLFISDSPKAEDIKGALQPLATGVVDQQKISHTREDVVILCGHTGYRGLTDIHEVRRVCIK
jgi:hypothetical protein